MNLDYLKMLYCECQKYDVMTMSVVGSQQRKKKENKKLGCKATKHIEQTFLISDYYQLMLLRLTLLIN